MRPGVLHSVTTVQDSLAIGGHFYAASTMKFTVFSLYHSFVNSGTITNGHVEEEQVNLLRIVLYWSKIMREPGYLANLEHPTEGNSGLSNVSYNTLIHLFHSL